MLSLDQLEVILVGGGCVEDEEAHKIIKENSTKGELLIKAGKEGYLNVVKFFLEASARFVLSSTEKEKCCNSEAVDSEGNTALHFAALNGHRAVVEYIISKGESADIKNKFLEPPLYFACSAGHESVVEFLMEHGAMHNCASVNEFKSPIEIAAFNGHAAVVQCMLLHGADRKKALAFAVEADHDNVFTVLLEDILSTGFLNIDKRALHVAAKLGRNDMCTMLLDAGVSVFKVNSCGMTPLELAAQHGHMFTVVLLLTRMRRGGPSWACVVRHGIYKRTAIDFAYEGGHLAIVRVLKSYGWSVNKRFNLETVLQTGRMLTMKTMLSMGEDLNSIDPTTAFHLACRGRVEVVQYLHEKGASIHTPDEALNSPLHLACMYKGDESVLRYLISQGANMNAKNKKGMTPLHMARDFSLQKVLIERGADPNIPDDSGNTVLHGAAKLDFVQLLLQCNVLVDARAFNGRTPLMIACYFGRTEIAETLIQHGANVNARDKYGVMLLDRAVLNGMTEIVELLREYDAVEEG